MHFKVKFILIVISLASLSSCIKEKFDSDKLSKSYIDEISVAVPIGYVNASMEEILAPQLSSGVLIQDADGLLSFRFNQDTIKVLASDIIQFPQFDSAYAIVNNTGQVIDLNPLGTQVQITQSFNLDFGFSLGRFNEEIDSILLNNMDMDIDVAASGTLNASLNATFPGIRYNNLAYSKNLIVSSSNSYSDLMSNTIHLQNSGSKKNQLQVNLTLNMGQTARIIAPGEKIADVYLNFSAIDFKLLYGYIGQIAINPAAIIDNRIELLNDNLNGYFNFDHGYIGLNASNSFGMPFGFQLENFSCRAYYAPTNALIFQNTSVPSQTADIAFPNMSQIGQSIKSEGIINTGDIRVGFQDYYSLLSSDLSGKTNPNGKQNYNFVDKKSELDIVSDFILPFWGNTNNLRLTDSITFPLAGFFSTTYVDIERLLFIMNFTNALPMNSKTQIYFCNASGTKLDSMFVSPIQISGSTKADGNGKVGAEPANPVKAEMLASRLPGISQTAYLLIVSDLKTIGAEKSPPDSWKFFSDYYFYFHIGIAATVKR